ncbi:MAG TPA: ATP synthase subunit I [Woeseiaceae bacterium]|nr:ATP synthase subunit I [Woeseiaceae bacterium]
MLRILAAQFGLGAVMAAVCWSMYGAVQGYSALLGGLIAALPNAFLALRLSMPRRDPGARPLVRAAYIGELGKLALTVLLFSTVFVTVRPLAAASLFITYVVTALVPLAGLLMRHDDWQQRDTVDKHGE